MSSDDPDLLTDPLSEELIDGASPAQQIPIPAHWEDLLTDVFNAAMANKLDPDNCQLLKLDKYDVVFLRGEGGFGLVFEVYDPDLERNVALKLCRTRDNETAEDVMAEARTLAKLTHPNVVTVHEVGRWGDDVFFVMDYVRGGTVDDFAKQHPAGRPPWQQIVEIYLAAGAGLAAAHKQKIVHGDFKPTNVLVEADGSWPRVADFGLARVRLEHTPDDEREEVCVRAGTLGFAAPESLRGLAVDERSDQWSFCASLWYTLEEVPPFVAKSTPEMLEVIERFEPWCIKANVPEQLRAVLRTGLAVESEDRFADMATLLRALEAVLAGAPKPAQVDADEIELPLSPPVARRRKWPSWGPAAITLMVVAGSVLGAASWWRSTDVEPLRAGVRLLVPERAPAVSKCALGLGTPFKELHPITEGVCELVRAGKVKDASDVWDAERNRRLPRVDDGGDLAVDTLIIARTFVDHAESALLDGRVTEADSARKKATYWVRQATGTLGHEHAGVRFVEMRASLVELLAQSQHSTTPPSE